MNVSTVAGMRALDQAAVEKFGIRSELLMENAGQAVYHAISSEWGVEGGRFIVFCGVGHNGGDGLVVARLLHANGGAVRVFVLGDPDRFDGPARLNYEIVSRLPVEVQVLRSAHAAKAEIDPCDVIVDAILGTGLSREVTGLRREIIELINASDRTVFSVDIPSGVHGDTAAVMGVAVRASYTVTFGLPKIGNMLPPGSDLCGKLFVCHISFPRSLYEPDHDSIETNDPATLLDWGRDPSSAERSRALFVTGSACGHERSDLAASAYRETARSLSGTTVPMAIAWSIGEECEDKNESSRMRGVDSREIGLRNKQLLLDLARETSIVVLDSSLAADRVTKQLVEELVRGTDAPLLLSGKVMSSFHTLSEMLRERRATTILILTESDVPLIARADGGAGVANVETLRSVARKHRAVVVLIDWPARIVFPNGRVLINLSGNNESRLPDSGDTLAGIIAAIAGRQGDAEAAVREGVYLNGLAADLRCEERGKRALTQQEILSCLPRAIGTDLQDLSGAARTRYKGGQLI